MWLGSLLSPGHPSIIFNIALCVAIICPPNQLKHFKVGLKGISVAQALIQTCSSLAGRQSLSGKKEDTQVTDEWCHPPTCYALSAEKRA